MDLSIIIAHYDPGNHLDCLDSFQMTLAEILAQKDDYNIEIIIADDGSVSNKNIIQNGAYKINESGKNIYYLTGDKLVKWKIE